LNCLGPGRAGLYIAVILFYNKMLKYHKAGKLLKYKLIVTDLDDTLLRDDLTISERSRRTIKRAMDRGCTVAVATGRMYPSAIPYARMLGLKGPILCCQGAQIADIETGSTIKITGVPKALAAEALRFAEARGLYIQYYSTEQYFFEKACEQSDYYGRMAGVQGSELGRKCSEALDFDPVKLLIIASPPRIREVYAEALDAFGGRLEIAISKSNYLELTHPDANKGGAVKALAALMGIPREQVMAVGDALNDLPMLRFAGLGVAVANGDEKVKAEAGAVTASNEEDGVAVAIEEYALEE
jgi:Cof subfamily protein (haloacid dehalogenase superfamily)